MVLSLTAEQKSVLKIFKIEEQYIIPAYQRPYSWEYDQCFQLYNDLFEAFKNNEDYFIGNIIIAKSDADRGILEVIDGQQRLISLLLFMKVLSLMFPELKILVQVLELEDWEGNKKLNRIESEIFEANDEDKLKDILAITTIEDIDDRLSKHIDGRGNFIERRNNNRFEINTLYFYYWLKFYSENHDDLKDFVKFLLERVYLLPIELSGKTLEEANEKALVIFETINNRGMNLEDADIFKAKLYKKARQVDESDKFIDLWKDLKYSTDKLKIEIDDLFRFYSHIIRGQEGITSSEINLRDFFTTKNYSPFEVKKYEEILDDLFKIVEILECYNNLRDEKTFVSKWIQVIDIYTNQYPKLAVISYLFKNEFNLNDNKFESFLKSLVRYIYYQGSTTRIKFEIYTIIKNIFINKDIDNYYYNDISIEYFDYLGRLKYGFSLLAFYLNEKNPFIPNYSIDKIISYKDKDSLPNDWTNKPLDTDLDRLGNFIVLDIPKKNIPFLKRKSYYQNSKIDEIRNISKQHFSYEEFEERDKRLKERLLHFFKG